MPVRYSSAWSSRRSPQKPGRLVQHRVKANRGRAVHVGRKIVERAGRRRAVATARSPWTPLDRSGQRSSSTPAARPRAERGRSARASASRRPEPRDRPGPHRDVLRRRRSRLRTARRRDGLRLRRHRPGHQRRAQRGHRPISSPRSSPWSLQASHAGSTSRRLPAARHCSTAAEAGGRSSRTPAPTYVRRGTPLRLVRPAPTAGPPSGAPPDPGTGARCRTGWSSSPSRATELGDHLVRRHSGFSRFGLPG